MSSSIESIVLSCVVYHPLALPTVFVMHCLHLYWYLFVNSCVISCQQFVFSLHCQQFVSSPVNSVIMHCRQLYHPLSTRSFIVCHHAVIYCQFYLLSTVSSFIVISLSSIVNIFIIYSIVNTFTIYCQQFYDHLLSTSFSLSIVNIFIIYCQQILSSMSTVSSSIVNRKVVILFCEIEKKCLACDR